MYDDGNEGEEVELETEVGAAVVVVVVLDVGGGDLPLVRLAKQTSSTRRWLQNTI